MLRFYLPKRERLTKKVSCNIKDEIIGVRMLAISRLYSFLDHKNGVNLHFLEGQKLIHDLVLLHPMQGNGFAYFRDTLLGIMPIVFFLKPGENLGIYIDSCLPYLFIMGRRKSRKNHFEIFYLYINWIFIYVNRIDLHL